LNFKEDLGRAGDDLGIEIRIDRDRTHARCEIKQDGEILIVGLPDRADLDPHLLDVDGARGGFLMESTVSSVQREPNFDLMLEETRRVRHVVLQGAEGWVLREVDGARTVAEVLDSGTGPER